MVHFLHTADWHVGIRFSKLGQNAEKARKIRIDTVKSLLDSAKEKKVDFIIAAGDLFDSNDVDRKLIRKITTLIKDIDPIPVYILPGNHDPLTRDSLFHDETWKTIDNVYIFKDEEPVKISNLGVTLYPFPIKQKQTREDITRESKGDDKHISIGIAHGNLQIKGFLDEPNFPIDVNRVDKAGFDYLALGEWHSYYTHKGLDGVVRTVYPGTPETTKFGEKDSGKAVFVKIKKKGAKPEIIDQDFGVLKWEEISKEISNLEDIKHLEKELIGIKSPKETLVNISFRGVVDQECADFIEIVESRIADDFLYLNFDEEQLHLKPNLKKLKAMIPEGVVFANTINALQAMMKQHSSMEELTDMSIIESEKILRELRGKESVVNAEPETIERALLALYQILKEE